MTTYCFEAYAVKCSGTVQEHFGEHCKCFEDWDNHAFLCGLKGSLYKTYPKMQKFVFLEKSDYGKKFVLDMPREIKLFKLAYDEDSKEGKFCKKCLHIMFPAYSPEDMQQIANMYLKDTFSVKEFTKYMNLTLGDNNEI